MQLNWIEQISIYSESTLFWKNKSNILYEGGHLRSKALSKVWNLKAAHWHSVGHFSKLTAWELYKVDHLPKCWVSNLYEVEHLSKIAVWSLYEVVHLANFVIQKLWVVRHLWKGY